MKTLSITKLCIIGILVPVFIFGTIKINEKAGQISGSGGTKSGEIFSVIAKSFTINISNPDDGLREITVSVPVENITTENWMRDVHMRMSVFKKAYPNVEFLAKTDAEIIPGNLALTGNLIINGVSREKTINLTLSENNDNIVATGLVSISLDHFEIKSPGMGPMKVSDTVSIAINVPITTNSSTSAAL